MFRQLSRQTVKALPSSRILYSRPVHTTPTLHTDSDDTDSDDTEQQEPKWKTAYSEMTIPEAEQRLGLTMEHLRVISVDTMLANARYSYGRDVVLKTKEMVYYRILQCLQLQGYPTEANPDFTETNVSHLALFFIGPVVAEFKRKTGRNVILRREKEIISTDNETGGTGEFVVMDRVSWDEKFVLIIEAKHSSTGEAMKQCLLALKDARDNNGGGIVYGFVTTGVTWRMLRYDGMFQMSEEMETLFETMGDDKEGWIKNYSNLVDCMFAALNTSSMSESSPPSPST